MKKKLLSVIAAASLAMTSFAALAVTASAADSDYTITIPSTLSVANPGWNSIGSISAEGTLAGGKKLTVSAESANSWALKSGENSVSYTLNNGSDTKGDAATSWEFTSLPATQAIGIDVEDYSTKPVGTYTDTVTFTAKVESAVPDSYTLGGQTIANGSEIVVKVNYNNDADYVFTGTFNDGVVNGSASGGGNFQSGTMSISDGVFTYHAKKNISAYIRIAFDTSNNKYTITKAGNGSVPQKLTFKGISVNGVDITSMLTQQ